MFFFFITLPHIHLAMKCICKCWLKQNSSWHLNTNMHLKSWGIYSQHARLPLHLFNHRTLFKRHLLGLFYRSQFQKLTSTNQSFFKLTFKGLKGLAELPCPSGIISQLQAPNMLRALISASYHLPSSLTGILSLTSFAISTPSSDSSLSNPTF